MKKLIRLEESMHRAARAAGGFGNGREAVDLRLAWPRVLGDSFAWRARRDARASA